MEKIRVKFATREYEKGSYVNNIHSGVVMDRYSDIVTVEQPMPSGMGGRVDLKDFKLNADFYLILADNGGTYKIRCVDVVIDTKPSAGGN